MKRTCIFFTIFLLASGFALAADSTNPATKPSADQVEVNYTKSIEGRAADILKILALSDTNKVAHVRDAITDQYRSLRAWHDANDAKLKAAKGDTNAIAEIRTSLKVIHQSFLSKLSESLTPAQVEQVKDKMTYGKVQFTFAGYMSAYPDLPVEHQQKILEILKLAREDAMDGGSADEKTAVFQKAKGRINNYLSKQGIHPQKPKNTNQ